MSASGRYCCKSLFALLIKNSPGCRRDFRVKMWGTSSPDDKLTGDLGNVIEATQIGGRRSDRLMAGKLSPGNFGLLQQYRHKADIPRRLLFCPLSGAKRNDRPSRFHMRPHRLWTDSGPRLTGPRMSRAGLRMSRARRCSRRHRRSGGRRFCRLPPRPAGRALRRSH
jgi:hypothetical protein